MLFGAFRFKVDASGRERLPVGGGYLLVAAIHRGWMDPFLIMHALPLEPRVWFLGSGPSAFSAKWREWLLHRVGGMLPVWRRGVGVEQHVASAQAVLRNGGVFVLVPEGGVSGPPDGLAAFRVGSALIALRTGSPIGRSRSPAARSSTSANGWRPGSWPRPARASCSVRHGRPQRRRSREELELANALTDRLAELFALVIPVLHAERSTYRVDRGGSEV